MKGKFIYFFGHNQWLVGDAPSTWHFGSNLPTQLQNASKTVIFNRYSLVAAQPLHLAKNVQLTNRFHVSQCHNCVVLLLMLTLPIVAHVIRYTLQRGDIDLEQIDQADVAAVELIICHPVMSSPIITVACC